MSSSTFGPEKITDLVGQDLLSWIAACQDGAELPSDPEFWNSFQTLASEVNQFRLPKFIPRINFDFCEQVNSLRRQNGGDIPSYIGETYLGALKNVATAWFPSMLMHYSFAAQSNSPIINRWSPDFTRTQRDGLARALRSDLALGALGTIAKNENIWIISDGGWMGGIQFSIFSENIVGIAVELTIFKFGNLTLPGLHGVLNEIVASWGQIASGTEIVSARAFVGFRGVCIPRSISLEGNMSLRPATQLDLGMVGPRVVLR